MQNIVKIMEFEFEIDNDFENEKIKERVNK